MSIALSSPTWHSRTNQKIASDVQFWTAACRRYARSPQIKEAENAMAGPGDVPFEMAMSNLAHSHLRARAPQLLPYELGFQLLEKNEDNDRAVGVFGFQVGPQMLYAPVFFLNGELKGHELLWLKDSDTFVPMQEEWINYILNRKPVVLGEEASTNMRELGADRPPMHDFRESPSKYASAHPAWLREGLPGLMYALGRHIEVKPSVPELVKASAWMATKFLSMIDARPQLAEKFAACYGADTIRDAIKVAKTLDSVQPIEPKRQKKAKAITGSVWKTEKKASPNAALKIWVYDGEPPEGLTEKQADVLKRDGIYVEDLREEKNTSQVLNIQMPMAMQNPDNTGLYDVLTKPDSFDRCLIVTQPQGKRGRKAGCVLVRVGDEDSKAYTTTHPAKVFAIEQYSPSDYNDYWGGLSEADSLERGATYILLTARGEGTYPFKVRETMPAEGDEKCYKIRWLGGYGDDRPDDLPPIARREDFYDYESDAGPDMVSLNRIKGPRFINRLRTLFVPEGAKLLKLKKPDMPDYDCEPCCSKNSDPPALRPGNHVDLQLGIYKTSSELKVINGGTEAWINNRRFPRKAAFIHLMTQHGLSEKTAQDILSKKTATYRIKYAQPYGQEGVPYELQQGGPYAPATPEQEQMGQDTFFGSMVPTQEYTEEEYQVPELETTTARPNAALPPEPEVMNQVMEAANSGQQEVLDTAVLSNLLEGSRDDTLIDQYLPNLVKGLDSIGRLLFNFYWHNDTYEERFDSGELPELEDALRNSFENLGKLTLKLKQKSIEPYIGEGAEVDLEPSSE